MKKNHQGHGYSLSWELYFLSLLVLYSIYPGQDLPVISDLVPVFSGVFDSGIWFFILGTMIGIFAILGRLLLEATSE